MAIVEVNGEEIEFPDDMPDDQIAAVLQKQFPVEQPAQPETWESKAVRATKGALDPALGIAQLVPRGIGAAASLGGLYPNKVSQMADELAGKQDAIVKGTEQWYQDAKSQDGQTGFDGMRMAGNVLSPVNLMLAPVAAKLAGVGGTGLAAKVGQGAAIGAGYGATAPVAGDNYAEEKAKQVGLGALIGGAMPAAGAAVAKAINPAIEKGKQLLIDSGVRLTPGQIMGGMAQRTEDKLTSIPIMGDAIQKAKQRGYEDLNRAAANRALEPIGQKLPDSVKVGHDLVNHVDDALGQAYDNLVPQLTGKIDAQFTQDMQQLATMARQLPPSMRKQFDEILKQQLYSKVSPNGSITGHSLKEIESVLGQKARGYMQSQDFDQRQLGDAIRQTQANLREWLARQNPQHADKLRKINQGWANYTRIREAAGSVGAKEGVFSPAQLSNKVRSMGGKSGYAKGTNLMQDLSDAGKQVLPSTYPDSGSIGRLALGGLATGAGYFSPASLGTLMAGGAAYTRPGQALLQYLLASPKLGKLSKPAADAVRKITSPADLAKLLTR